MEKEIKSENKIKANVETDFCAQYSNGITLVALIITIIILIILAGVSLNVALGENGIFRKSKNAVDIYQDSAKNEERKLDKALGDIEILEGKCYLPEGFEHTEGSINTGLVISNKETEDEFVWIPVEMPVVNSEEELEKEIKNGKYPMAVKIEGKDKNGRDNYTAKTYRFRYDDATNDKVVTELQTASYYKEPDIVSQYDGTDSDNVGITKELMQEEYNKMIESVIKNNGFYIGRYESGDLSKEKAVTKRGNTDLTGKTWYKMYEAQKDIYGDELNIKTNMIWGSQWSQVMIWMKNIQNKTLVENNFYVLDSRNMGNYLNSTFKYIDAEGKEVKKENGEQRKIPTGSTEISKVKNIYDMAGNVYEWTMEVVNTDCRITRGGSYRTDDPKQTIVNKDGRFYPYGSERKYWF